MKNYRVQPGVERAKVFARALQCHPAVLAGTYSTSLQRKPNKTVRFACAWTPLTSA